MSQEYFKGVGRVRYEGPATDNPFAFRFYEAGRAVLGKPMRDHLRIAVCYWHSFCWPGTDMFGDATLQRPWFTVSDPIEAAKLKALVAFEFFEKLGAPFFCFHDKDVAPEGRTLAESNANLDRVLETVQGEMARTGIKLLWGTANLFSHPRYVAGAATNPDPEVFAYAAGQVKHMLETTHRLGGENYVLWGGREGYDTLLNTDMKRELDQLGRFMALVADHKHKIGFKGTLLIEPKPQEPTKHQYDYDAAAVHAFLRKYDLIGEFRLNIEVNHATLSGHTFQHELAYAFANDLFGSVDINRGDPLCGWDTDQFPNNIEEATLALYTILQGGGFTTGGFNFDAKLRRQSIDPDDLFHAHIGGIDTLARGLLNAEKMISEGRIAKFVESRYSGWRGTLGEAILNGKMDLETLSNHVISNKLTPKPKSGRQEMLENWVNCHL